MKFSKDYQPTNRYHAEPKVTYSVRIRQTTRQWLKDHRKTGGDVIEEYVKDKEDTK